MGATLSWKGAYLIGRPLLLADRPYPFRFDKKPRLHVAPSQIAFLKKTGIFGKMPILGEIPRLFKGLHKPGGSGSLERGKSGFLSSFSLFRQFVLACGKE
jgi:hypothetical protein